MFSAQDIKVLRLRLGWTHSDLARRLSCCPKEVAKWEEGLSSPDGEAINHIQYLLFQAENVSNDLRARPLVDRCLSSLHLEQISADDWKKLLSEEETSA